MMLEFVLKYGHIFATSHMIKSSKTFTRIIERLYCKFAAGNQAASVGYCCVSTVDNELKVWATC